MPLRDHFRSPFVDVACWEEVHGQWPAVIVQQLGQLLPREYTAGPRVHLGARVEVDVATFQNESGGVSAQNASSGIATAMWTHVEPTLAVETALSDFDEYEVRVYDTRRGRRLVAAIELISPENKDRPENRSQFTAKCAALLRQGVSLVLVDVVTQRDFNLYNELLQLIGERDHAVGEEPSATYAVACHWVPRGAKRWLEAWYHPLAPSEPLPSLPLWLTECLAITLDLETSYEQTCLDLRIP